MIGAIRHLGAALALALLVALGGPALAVEPDEKLDDPALEARARDLSAGLRCLVCQNQTIDDSNAPLARDLRLLVRERLSAGDSDEEVMEFVVDRYGDFVLLKPPFTWETAALWAAPVILVLVGVGVIAGAMRQRQATASRPLSAEERAALDELRRGEDAARS